MKIVYIAETSLTNNSAYTHHIVKMCDAFSQLNQEVVLYLPQVQKNFKYVDIEKKYLLLSKKKFKIKSLINFKLTNFFLKIFFLLQVLKNIYKDKPTIILTRSFLSSIILSLFKIKHILEIHSEFQSLTKFLIAFIEIPSLAPISSIILLLFFKKKLEFFKYFKILKSLS